MIKLFHPYVSEQAIKNVEEVLRGSQLAQGPQVDLFEKKFAETFGFETWQIVSLNSGTSALELAYELSGIGMHHGKRLEVITPVLTCTATNIPLVRKNAQIVFADVEGVSTLNIDPRDVQRKITTKTHAIVFVHFGGNSRGLKEIEVIAESNNIDLICDAAQALGAPLSKKARFSAISLQAIKSLTAGDGGVLICRDKEDAKEARKLRWFGYDRDLKQKYGDTDLDIAGYKYHMNDISAAIALGNLSEWNGIVKHRDAINAVYANFGASKGYIPGIWNPQVVGMSYSKIKPSMTVKGIEIGQHHYPNNKYSLFRYALGDCPKMKSLDDKYFMLPCHMHMTIDDATFIAKTLWN